MPAPSPKTLRGYLHRLFGSTAPKDGEAAVPGPDWHPHFGRIAGVSLDSWLSGFPADVQPRHSLVLATDERTGSELLCQLLGATGRLGRPSEYLNTSWMQRFIPDYPADVASQVAIAHRAGTTPNGCFSMKVHPWHIDRLLSEGTISHTFPTPTFVRLMRRDLLGQAISLHRARQTGRYHSHIQEERPAGFDAEAIGTTMRDLAANRARWDLYFARIGTSPLTVTYEELCADLFQVVHRVAAAMGETVDRTMVTSFTPIRRQADELSVEWRARYIHECGSVDRFDRL